MLTQHTLTISTDGRATIDITAAIEDIVLKQHMSQGLCQVFLHHTSASLIVTENADQDVRRDLENFIQKLVKDGDPDYFHDQEGDDDMAAHIRSVLTQTEISIPVTRGKLNLGTWQGVYLWEHRYHPHRRKMTITLMGADSLAE